MYDAIINNNNIKKKNCALQKLHRDLNWLKRKEEDERFVVAVVSGVFFLFVCFLAAPPTFTDTDTDSPSSNVYFHFLFLLSCTAEHDL